MNVTKHFFPLYFVTYCPFCKNIQVNEIRRKKKTNEMRFKCRKCNKTFQAEYKKGKWKGDKRILGIFGNPHEATNFIKNLKLRANIRTNIEQ